MGAAKLQVIHDFDNAYPSGRWAFKRGVQLIIYAVSRKFGFLRRFVESVYCENFEYALTLQRLDNLLGVRSLFGLNDTLPFNADLRSLLGDRAIRHWHVSKTEVHWEPEINVPEEYWWMDQEYAKGNRPLSEKDRFILFHCDYPQLLPHYIQCLWEAKRKGFTI